MKHTTTLMMTAFTAVLLSPVLAAQDAVAAATFAIAFALPLLLPVLLPKRQAQPMQHAVTCC